MSRRCRASLFQGTAQNPTSPTDGDLSSGCDCGRLGGGISFPCTEPLIHGELLGDSGFEQTFDLMGNGRLDLPQWNSVDKNYTWGGDPFAPEASRQLDPVLPWHTQFGVTWRLNITEQDTGVYCLESFNQAPGTGTQYLTPANVRSCNHSSLEPMFRMETGDVVTTKVRAKTSVGAQKLRFSWDFINNFGPSFIGAGVAVVDMVAGGYTTYTMSAFVSNSFNPSTPVHWGRLQLRGDVVSGSPKWFLDNASVVLLPASATGILLCAFNSLITIDNSTTETSFL